MRLRHLLFVAASVTICSCFLKQDPPATQVSPVFSPTEGLIVLEDISGDQAAAAILGAFDLKTNGRSSKRLSVDAVDFPVVGFHELAQARTPECQIIQASRDGESQSRTTGLLSAGQMSFGVALQSTLQTVTENSDNSYFLKLDPGVPSDVYQVQVAGSTSVPAFATTLAMPENLSGVTVASSTMDSHTIAIKKSTALNITWKGPTFINDQSLMVLDIYADTANSTIQVHCVTPETSQYMDHSGTKQWTIPSDYMSQLPTTNTAQVYLARASAFDGTQDNLDLQVQGLRSSFVNASIE